MIVFENRGTQRRKKFIPSKLTDDLLLAGTTAGIVLFEKLIKKGFALGKVVYNSEIRFNGCVITHSESEDIDFSMHDYLEEVKPVRIIQNIQLLKNKATDDKIKSFWRLVEKLARLGCEARPPAAYFWSYFQQQVPHHHFSYIVDGSRCLKQFKKLSPIIKYCKAARKTNGFQIVSYADASCNTSRKQVYGKSGLLNGIMCRTSGSELRFFHIIHWTSRIQKLVCFSSYGAGIFACAATENRRYALKQGTASMFP